MELLSRYRNVTVLLLVIFAQLVLLGYQVRSPSQTALARVIGTGAGANSRVVFIDRSEPRCFTTIVARRDERAAARR